MAQPSVRYRVWVGGLPRDIAQDAIGAKFSKYGPIQDITVRHSDVDTYCFVTYTERQDAEEAIKGMDRSCAWGTPVKVNISKDFPPNGPRKRGTDGKPINSPAPAPLAPPPGWRSPPRRCPPRRRDSSRDAPRQQYQRSRSRKQHRSRGDRGPGPMPPPRDGDYDRGPDSYGSRSTQPPMPPPRGGDYGREPPRGYRPPPRDHHPPDPPLPPRGGPRGYPSPPRRSGYGDGYGHPSPPQPPRGDHRDYPPARGYSPRGSGYNSWHDGPGRSGGPPPRGHSPPPYREPPPRAPPSPPRGPLGHPKVGRHRLTIENIPEDMSWLELKDLGKEYGDSVTFSRTYRRGSVFFGMLEFGEESDARRTIAELNGRRIQGGTVPMRAYEGDSWNS